MVCPAATVELISHPSSNHCQLCSLGRVWVWSEEKAPFPASHKGRVRADTSLNFFLNTLLLLFDTQTQFILTKYAVCINNPVYRFLLTLPKEISYSHFGKPFSFSSEHWSGSVPLSCLEYFPHVYSYSAGDRTQGLKHIKYVLHHEGLFQVWNFSPMLFHILVTHLLSMCSFGGACTLYLWSFLPFALGDLKGKCSVQPSVQAQNCKTPICSQVLSLRVWKTNDSQVSLRIRTMHHK